MVRFGRLILAVCVLVIAGCNRGKTPALTERAASVAPTPPVPAAVEPKTDEPKADAPKPTEPELSTTPAPRETEDR